MINMKNALAILALLVCACSVPASGSGAAELHVGVSLTTGEHSKDSNSQTTTITVARDVIVWERTFSGRRSRTPASRKEFRLSPTDKAKLRSLIKSNDLLVTDSIELPQEGSNYRYFEISVEINLDGTKGAISISAPETAVTVKDERLYRNTLTLVKELYRIMNNQDKKIDFSDLSL
jgi:hypothetical protein